MTIDIKELRKVSADCYWPTSPVTINSLLDRLEAAEKERDALRAKVAEMEKTWLSPEGYHILMQEREDILFQAEKMKQHAPCKDISMWPTHHTQPTQPAPSVPDGYKLVPIVSTDEMDNAGADHCDGYLSTAQVVWDAMLAAAPEVKL